MTTEMDEDIKISEQEAEELYANLVASQEYLEELRAEREAEILEDIFHAMSKMWKHRPV